MISKRNAVAGLFFASLLLVFVAWLRSDVFPEDLSLDPAIAEPPRQVRVDSDAFMVRANDEPYRVQPLYRYEFTGLVVSFSHFEPGFGLHERWNDYINVADVCVVWGTNASQVDLNKFDFWNGQFTCNFGTSDGEAWRRFDKHALANNHLLTEKPHLQAVLDDLRVGDQIHVRGWLSEYGQPGGHVRGTSTSRTDSGDGACETVYLEDITILSSMNNPWRRIYWAALAMLALSVVLWFRIPIGSLVRS